MPEVVIYTTAWCPYCVRAKSLLKSKGVTFQETSGDGKPALRAEMARKAARTGACSKAGCDAKGLIGRTRRSTICQGCPDAGFGRGIITTTHTARRLSHD